MTTSERMYESMFVDIGRLLRGEVSSGILNKVWGETTDKIRQEIERGYGLQEAVFRESNMYVLQKKRGNKKTSYRPQVKRRKENS